MVGRGVVWASGLALALAFVACGGRSTEEPAGEGGEAGDVSTGGSKSTGGRSAAGNGTTGALGGTAGSGVVGGSAGTGVTRGGTSSTGGTCTEGGSPGGRSGGNGCPLPWWGTPLEGVKGLLTCPDPYDPALLAYGQTNIPSCWQITGPVAESTESDGGIACCYHYDQRACCGADYQADDCIEIPYFGDGTVSVSLPTAAVDDRLDACGRSFGEPIELTRTEAAQRMIGVWLTCGVMPAPYVGDGFIFRGDGTFHAIVLDDDRRLSESEGCMQGGLWGFYSETGQLNLYVEDRTGSVFPTFTSGVEERLMLDSVPFVRASWPGGG